MFGKHRGPYGLVSAALLLMAVTSACSRPNTSTSTGLFLERMDQTRGTAYPNYAYMSDNALLHDMSLADFHFVPHTDELSGRGAAKLERMAPLLNAYGGTLRYETLEQDERRIQQRLDHVREYLSVVGCNMDHVEVHAMMSGGRGLPAREAIEIKQKGTAMPKESASSGGSLMGAR